MYNIHCLCLWYKLFQIKFWQGIRVWVLPFLSCTMNKRVFFFCFTCAVLQTATPARTSIESFSRYSCSAEPLIDIHLANARGWGSSEIILALSIQLFQELTLGDPNASGKRRLPRIFVVGCGSFDPMLNIRGRTLLWTNVCVYNISLGNCIYQRKTYPFLLLFCFFLTIVCSFYSKSCCARDACVWGNNQGEYAQRKCNRV